MKNNTYSVSQINNYIKMLLDDDVLLDKIYVEGEISNYKEHSLGHIYFTIKDEECSINAIMYKQDASLLDLELYNGLKIVCFGKVSSYYKTGQCNFYAKNIQISGKGIVQENFEKLKEKLKKEGLFDVIHKRKIPKTPKTIGIITSPTGAAIKDMINVANRRNKGIKLFVIKALMQGNGAIQSIIDSINVANEYEKLDVIILARGGGSKEDLWVFNDESIARAIFSSNIPIITGIGHEIDFTIADFVADCRAETPSAAMEICAYKVDEAKDKLVKLYDMLNNKIDNILLKNKLRFEKNINKNAFISFPNTIKAYKKDILDKKIYINREIDIKIRENKLKLEKTLDKMEAVSPVNILKNGYAVLLNKDKKTIKSIKQVQIDDDISITLDDGEIKARVTKRGEYYEKEKL